MFNSNSFTDTFKGLTTLFNLAFRPKATFERDLNRMIDAQYENIVAFWPQEVRFENDHSAAYVKEFPENPSAYPENLDGMSFNSTQSISFTPVKKKWLTKEFFAAVDNKLENLQRAADFPECTLRLNGFELLKEIAADDSRAANERIAIDMYVNVNIQGQRKTPAPQQ
jgi:hypothetical protein